MGVAAHSSLNISEAGKIKTAQRLSSGIKINSAADDASGLAISTKMKAQLRGFERATLNIQDGVNLFYTTDGALKEMGDICIRIRELSIQACNDTNTNDDRMKMDAEVRQLIEEIDAISEKTEFNNIKVLQGNTQKIKTNIINTTTHTFYKAYISNTSLEDSNMKTALQNIDMSRYSTQNFYVNNADGSSTHISFDVNKIIMDNDTTFQSFLKNELYESDDTISTTNKARFLNTILDALNDGFQAENSSLPTVLGEYNAEGRIVFTLSDDKSFQLGGCSGDLSYTIGHEFLHMRCNPDASTSEIVTIINTTTNTTHLQRELFIQEGANANDGFTFIWNTTSSEILGLSNVSLNTLYESQKTLSECDNAHKYITNIRSNIGAYINRLESTNFSVCDMSNNISDAMTRILDADMAKEILEYIRLQTLTDASSAILSQANKNSQMLIKLLP